MTRGSDVAMTGRSARRRGAAVLQGLGGCLVVVAAALAFLPGRAAATPALTTPAGPYTAGQTITVTGSGFSTLASGNTIQILECSDPNGDPNNLPQDDSTCDGTTLNPGTIFPSTCPSPSTATNCFSASYTIKQLDTPANLIDCDATNDCVLWVGEDYVNNFTGSAQQPVAFSNPFLVNPASSGGGGGGGGGSGGTGDPGQTTGGGPTVTAGTPATGTTGSGSTSSTGGTTGTSASATSGATSTGAGESTATAASPSTSAGTASGPSLAYTGPPAALPWLAGLGALMVVSGSIARRRYAPQRS